MGKAAVWRFLLKYFYDRYTASRGICTQDGKEQESINEEAEV